VLAGPDEAAEDELLRAGGYAMPAIMARFPGPITMELERLESANLPRASECGPVLRLVATQRRTALPFVLAHVEDEDDGRRYWATFLLSDLVYADSVQPAINRIFDENPRIRRVARAATRAIAETHGLAVIERLEAVLREDDADRTRRQRAIEALGETREPLAVPVLFPLLDDPDPEIISSARQALVIITRQDLATDIAKWKSWWIQNEGRDRIEWLIDALMHEHANVRGAAGEELKTLTKEHFGYYEDLPRRERAAAQSRYREWWTSTGRVRFRRGR
jgi:HEAT repeat protein